MQGRSQDFSKGGSQQGHHPGIADYIWFIPLLSLVYQRAQSYYRGMKAHINLRQEPLTKKVGFSTMGFTAKILSWRFRHLNLVGCLLKRRPTKGESRAPRTPPSHAPELDDILRTAQDRASWRRLAANCSSVDR